MARVIASLAAALAALTGSVEAQTLFGSGCAGASGVTPTLSVVGTVKVGQTWTLEVAAPGGIGLGYLLIGFSNTTASAFGGLPLPFDLGVFFADPLWSGCPVNVDPSFALQPYVFEPNSGGGLATFTFPGFDFGTVYAQAVNIDADFATRIAGVSQGLAVRRTAPTGMVAIAPGTFVMGSNAPATAPYYNSPEPQPAHTVTLTEPYWIGRYEVTQAEYAALMGANPSFFPGPSRPVELVSWNDARAYCAALTAVETLAGNVPAGYEYRLPTEAEWEYACRAGTSTEFGTGNGFELFCSDACFFFSFHSNSSCNHPSGAGDVGGFAPNAWGLHDMHGNVWEWCLDSFAFYSAASLTDPLVTGGFSRIFRGGAWGSNSNSCRSAVRSGAAATYTNSRVGFRVALAPLLAP